VAVAFGVWIGFIHHGKSSPVSTQAAGATAVSASGLRTIAAALGQPIYWFGPRAGMTYELTHTPDGRIYLRYLPKGVAVGAPSPHLTIATYPVTNAYAATSGVAHRPNAVRIDAGAGAIAFYGANRPTNVYEAFKGSNYQIEVFSPSPAQAQSLVAQHKIRSIGSSKTSTSPAAAAGQTGAVAATLTEIRAVAGRLGRPVYWAGTRPGTTYELTETPDGRVYVRYLPHGVKVGSRNPYLTVATYPLQNAYTVTSQAAAATGTVKIPIRGAIAFYTTTRPTSIYIAFKNSNEQIEVFEPSTTQLRKLVANDTIKPVP
jgi:hypothetical protein